MRLCVMTYLSYLASVHLNTFTPLMKTSTVRLSYAFFACPIHRLLLLRSAVPIYTCIPFHITNNVCTHTHTQLHILCDCDTIFTEDAREALHKQSLYSGGGSKSNNRLHFFVSITSFPNTYCHINVNPTRHMTKHTLITHTSLLHIECTSTNLSRILPHTPHSISTLSSFIREHRACTSVLSTSDNTTTLASDRATAAHANQFLSIINSSIYQQCRHI